MLHMMPNLHFNTFFRNTFLAKKCAYYIGTFYNELQKWSVPTTSIVPKGGSIEPAMLTIEHNIKVEQIWSMDFFVDNMIDDAYSIAEQNNK